MFDRKKKKKQKLICEFCRVGYRVPAIPSRVHLCIDPWEKAPNNKIPLCEYHIKLYRDWDLSADWDTFSETHAKMEAIMERYFARRRS